MVVYATLKSQKALEKTDCTATLKGNMLGEKLEYKIPFTFDSSASAPSLLVIHHLAAKALITDWETARKEKKSIVDLSIESSVISSHTAFIAVDEESSEPVSGSMKVYNIQAPMRFSFGGGRGGGTRREAMHAAPRMRCMSGGGGGAPRGAMLPMNASPRMKDKKRSKGRSVAEGSPSLANCPTRLERDEMCLEKGAARAPESVVAVSPAPLSSLFGDRGGTPPKPTNTLEDLVSAQQLDGSWELTSSFAQLIGKPLADLEAACPIGREGVGPTVWATVLAVSLLRSRYSSQQDEWELIAMKAVSWLKKQNLSSVEKIFNDAKLFQ